MTARPQAGDHKRSPCLTCRQKLREQAENAEALR